MLHVKKFRTKISENTQSFEINLILFSNEIINYVMLTYTTKVSITQKTTSDGNAWEGKIIQKVRQNRNPGLVLIGLLRNGPRRIQSIHWLVVYISRIKTSKPIACISLCYL